MARARNIKPGFFTNDELVELPFAVRLLFIGLWTLADREGRLSDRPKKIKMEIFPADDVDCDDALEQLRGKGFLRRYEAEGARYIQIVNWEKHQNPHIKEAPSVIPAENGAVPEIPVQAPEKPEQAVLIPDSPFLIPDSLPPAPQSVARAAVGGFEKFWAAYPRKENKGAAEKAFKKLKPDGALLETILRAIEAQKGGEAWRKDGGQFIPHPATWLNGKRWEDEVKPYVEAEKPSPSAGAWWLTYETKLAKSREVGVGVALPGESDAAWTARIRAAIDNDGKPPAPKQDPPAIVTAAEPKRVDMSAMAREQRSKALKAALKTETV